MQEKSVSPETSNPEMTSQSFPVTCHSQSPEVKFHVFGTSNHGKGNSLSNIFLLFLSVHHGHFIKKTKKKKLKKKLYIHLTEIFLKKVSNINFNLLFVQVFMNFESQRATHQCIYFAVFWLQ